MFNFLFTKTPLAFLIQDLWRDEAFTALLSNHSIREIIQITAGDFSPPFYYIIVHFWMQIFGDSEFSLRMVSFLFFVATAFIAFLIMHSIWKISEKKSIVYVGVLLFSPFLLSYGFEARMYSMFAFFATLSYYAYFSKKYPLYTFAIVAGMFTHYFMAFVILTQLADTLTRKSIIGYLKNKKCSLVQIFHHPLVRSYVITGILFAPWVLFVSRVHTKISGEFWIIPPVLKDIFYIPFVLVTAYERVFGEYYHGQAGYHETHTRMLIFLVAILIFGFLFWRRYKDKSSVKSLLLWAFFTPCLLFVSSVISTPYYFPRYMIPSAVGMILLVVYSIESVRIGFLKVLIVLVLLCSFWNFHTWNLQYRSKRTVSTLYSEISFLLKPGDLVYVTSELDYHLAQYYLPSNTPVRLFNVPYDSIPQYVGKALIPSDAVSISYPSAPSRAFLVYYDHFEIRSNR